jgi:DNA polymerase V
MDLKLFKLESDESSGTGFAPLFSDGVSAGFPSPAENDSEGPLNLNSFMVIHPEATFYARVDGDSMIDAGIFDGDYLVVDRALDARENDIVVASVNGEFCVKVLNLQHNPPLLLPQNKNYSPIVITPDTDFLLFGVVTGVVRKLRHGNR